MDASRDERDPIDVLAEEFLERRRRGETPSLSEYATRHPELADEIRELFPALVLLEKANDESEPAPRQPPSAIGDYTILREIGRGGMGVVYEAEQRSLRRYVALKVLPSTADRRAVQRFRKEAQAAAKLHHAHIVPVFEVGDDQDVFYYAMQYINGQSLDRILEELKRMRSGILSKTNLATRLAAGRSTSPSPKDGPTSVISARLADFRSGSGTSRTSVAPLLTSLARIARQAADALHYAHSQGVVHRDVKPSNLILDAEGSVWVTDFGLAKMDDDGLTRTGDVLGTLRYMSPERFRGMCDARADIYGLGVTLYELLTLQSPFDSPDRLQLVEQIKSREPIPPRDLDKRIPRDLETIVLKAMEKDPRRRYATAGEMADDLGRFLADQPILARRETALEQLLRYLRNHRALTAIAGILLLSAIGASVAAFSLRSLANRNARLAREKAVEAQNAVNARDLSERRRLEARDARLAAESALAAMYTTHGLFAADQGSAREALLWFARAARSAPPDARQVPLARFDAWLRTVSRPAAIMPLGFERISDLKMHPDNRYLRTAPSPPLTEARLWDTHTGAIVPLPNEWGPVRAMAWSPDGKQLAVAGPSGKLTVCRFPQLDEPRSLSIPFHHPRADPLRNLAFSSDGLRLAVATFYTLGVCDLKRLEFAKPTYRHPSEIRHVLFPTPDRIVTTSGQRFLVFSANAGLKQPSYDGFHQLFRNPPLVDLARDLLISGGNAARRMDLVQFSTGKVLKQVRLQLSGLDRLYLNPREPVVVATSMRMHQRVQVPKGTVEPTVRGRAYGFDQQGDLLVADDEEIFSHTSAGRISVAVDPQGFALTTASKDGRFLAAQGGYDKLVVWRLPILVGQARPLEPSGTRGGVQLQGNRALRWQHTADAGYVAHIYDSRGELVGKLNDPNLQMARLLADGSQAALVLGPPGKPPVLQIRDLKTGKEVATAQPLVARPHAVTSSDDGRVLALHCGRQLVVLKGSQAARVALPAGARTASLCALPDGRALFRSNRQGTRMSRADPRDGGTVAKTPIHHRAPITDCRANAASQLVATSALSEDVKLWRLDSLQPVGKPLLHPHSVRSLAFSRDGRHLLTYCEDLSLRVWDVATRAVESPVIRRPGLVSAAFTAGARELLVLRQTGLLECYDWRTGRLIGPPLPIPISLSAYQLKQKTHPRLEVTRDDEAAVVAGPERVWLVRLSFFRGRPEIVDQQSAELFAEVVACRRFQRGTTGLIRTSEWVERWKKARANPVLRKLLPPPEPMPKQR